MAARHCVDNHARVRSLRRPSTLDSIVSRGPANANIHCAVICTFAFGATLHRALAGFTLDRFGNVWSTTHESIACPDAFTTVQPNPARPPWFVPALTVSKHGLRPISTTSAGMKFEGWKIVAMAYFP